MGYSDDALDRPIVGVTDTYSDFNPCHGNVPQLIEAVKRLQDGAIGDITSMRAYWNGATPWVKKREDLEKQYGRKLTEMEYQMRNWMYYTWLSGDHNVEQHIHSLDKMAWALQDKHLIKGGFAWAASSYRCNGYVPGQGLLDTMALTDLFTKVNNGRAPQRVYLTGTSKVLAPGLRVGFIAAPEALPRRASIRLSPDNALRRSR